MRKRVAAPSPREGQLSKETIIEAAIALLDGGEDKLTFRGLSERLQTGPGAIYWHVANKGELVTAACDAVVARTLDGIQVSTPKKTIRAVALALFDAIDVHPWVGSALSGVEGIGPMVRVLELVGRQVDRLGMRSDQRWSATGTLMAYMLGVSRQNAANGQLGRNLGIDREQFLANVATAWSQLDEKTYPFTRSVAATLRDHDDREDFLAGIDLILRGISA